MCVMAAARAAPTDLGTRVASYPWNEVFLEIDRLSRSGYLSLFYKQDGDYAVRIFSHHLNLGRNCHPTLSLGLTHHAYRT